ncbi:hypothetical protein C4D60_Mb06t05150 [Musa balbisiana]|uniref:Diacylglycerol kinase accessory domain-containing protein n=1 Tax=Musa balbisiana TaxID=52838 RepID=A0A4S8IKN9_MUSBA|nr:hypothetical protein C4D60_Mb06t05150 [Musa balbisiana]
MPRIAALIPNDKTLKSYHKKRRRERDDHFEGIGLLDRFEGIGLLGVRAIVLLNLDNYAGRGHPWGYPTPEYLEKKSFYEAHPDDGLLEIFGLKHAWHASCVMTELSPAVRIAQAAAVKLRLQGGDSKEAYMQMDGEPWKQPISKEYPTYVIIESTPFQSRIISGK